MPTHLTDATYGVLEGRRGTRGRVTVCSMLVPCAGNRHCGRGRTVPGRGRTGARRRPRPDGTGTTMLTRLLTDAPHTPDEREAARTGFAYVQIEGLVEAKRHLTAHHAGNLGPGECRYPNRAAA